MACLTQDAATSAAHTRAAGLETIGRIPPDAVVAAFVGTMTEIGMKPMHSRIFRRTSPPTD